MECGVKIVVKICITRLRMGDNGKLYTSKETNSLRTASPVGALVLISLYTKKVAFTTAKRKSTLLVINTTLNLISYTQKKTGNCTAFGRIANFSILSHPQNTFDPFP
jgi:hypothetical protein